MLLFFLVWLVAPLAELGIIIILCVKNDGYRQKIKDMEKMHRGGVQVMEEPRTRTIPPGEPLRQNWQPVPDVPAPESRAAGAPAPPRGGPAPGRAPPRPPPARRRRIVRRRHPGQKCSHHFHQSRQREQALYMQSPAPKHQYVPAGMP